MINALSRELLRNGKYLKICLAPEGARFKRIEISSLQYLKLRREFKMDLIVFVEMGKNMEK